MSIISLIPTFCLKQPYFRKELLAAVSVPKREAISLRGFLNFCNSPTPGMSNLRPAGHIAAYLKFLCGPLHTQIFLVVFL